MENETKEFFQKFQDSMGKMKELTPNGVKGFAGLFGNVMGAGALTVVEKELIALGMALGQQCEPYIKLHTKKALSAGATKEQILEASEVAVVMGGGPAYTHIPMVIDTLEALEG